MRQHLRKVSDQTLFAHIVLFGEQAEIVGSNCGVSPWHSAKTMHFPARTVSHALSASSA